MEAKADRQDAEQAGKLTARLIDRHVGQMDKSLQTGRETGRQACRMADTQVNQEL